MNPRPLRTCVPTGSDFISARRRIRPIIQPLQASPNTWKLRDGSVLVVGKNRNYFYCSDGETGVPVVVDDSQAQLIVKHAQSADEPPVHSTIATDVELDRVAEVVQRLRSRNRCE